MVQTIVDSVSNASYESYQLTIESMGSDVRNRNWISSQGVGSPGNQAAQAYLENAFTGMGLNVTTQGAYLNVIGELPGTAKSIGCNDPQRTMLSKKGRFPRRSASGDRIGGPLLAAQHGVGFIVAGE